MKWVSRTWTATERERAIRMALRGFSCREIAAELERTGASVSGLLQRCGVKTDAIAVAIRREVAKKEARWKKLGAGGPPTDPSAPAATPTAVGAIIHGAG